MGSPPLSPVMKIQSIKYLCLLSIAGFVALNLLIFASLHLPTHYSARLWKSWEEDVSPTKEALPHVIAEEDFLEAWDAHAKAEGRGPRPKERGGRTKPKGSHFVDYSCSMERCFNFSQCQPGNFKIYVYPMDNYDQESGSENPAHPISPVYSKILDALRASKYATANPHEACVFIPPVDTVDRDPLSVNYQRDAASRLRQLPFWRDHGANHLLFNMYAGTWPDYSEEQFGIPVDRAILVKASFSQQFFRHNYDVSLPLIHEEHSLWPRPANALPNFLQSVRKRYLLSFKGKRYLTGIGSFSRNALFHLHNGEDIVLLTTCRHGRDWRRKQDARCPIDNKMYDEFDYKDLMQNSTLCLVPRGRRLGSYRFLEALEAGCVPVMLSNDWVLPFSEVIDWQAAVVWTDERTLFQVPDLVRNLGDERIVSMRQQTKFLWDTYFSSVKSIVDTVLEILRDRVEFRTRSLLAWNSPSIGGLLDLAGYSLDVCETPFAAARARCGAAVDRGAAVSIFTGPNLCSGPRLLTAVRELARSKRVKKVLILWGCSQPPPSVASFGPHVRSKNLLIVRLSSSEAKSPGARFLWSPRIAAFLRPVSAVFSLSPNDVDALGAGGIGSDHLDFAYSLWHEFPEALVGFRSRGHFWDEAAGLWRYSSRPVASYSMVTGPLIFHKYYAYLYTNYLSSKSHQLVDLFQCCEDILMNFLVAHATRRPPIRALDVGLGPSLSLKEPAISAAKLQDKIACLHALARDFTYMPLRRSFARWDPLLYRDEVAAWRKKYARLETSR